MPALAARRLVAAALVRVGGDLGPGGDRVAEAGLRLAVHLDEHAAGIGVAHPGRRVGVPGERRTARAAARLVLRGVRTDRRIVGLLGLPGDDPVLDVDLPRARAGAVHPVRGADDLVVAPTVPVEDVAVAAALLGTPPAGRRRSRARVKNRPVRSSASAAGRPSRARLARPASAMAPPLTAHVQRLQQHRQPGSRRRRSCIATTRKVPSRSRRSAGPSRTMDRPDDGAREAVPEQRSRRDRTREGRAARAARAACTAAADAGDGDHRVRGDVLGMGTAVAAGRHAARPAEPERLPAVASWSRSRCIVGSLGRIPVGALTDRLGARRMFPVVALLTACRCSISAISRTR